MKSVSIHPFSALAGAGLLGLALLASGAVQVPGSAQPIMFSNGLVRVAGIPDPRQMVVIKEGAPFIVPAGKILVVTALGALTNGIVVDLLVDGQKEAEVVANMPTANPGTIDPLPVGLTVHAGSTVEPFCGSIFGRAWGYLVDS